MKTFYFFSIFFLLSNCKEQLHDISQINFKADACFGTCPVFEMNIADDGTAHYDAQEFNEREGQFNAVIRHEELDRLMVLIEKSDFFHLKNEYSAEVTDMPTYTLTIKLKNGQSKTIKDYGPIGPDALQLVYKEMFSIRQNQSWHR